MSQKIHPEVKYAHPQAPPHGPQALQVPTLRRHIYVEGQFEAASGATQW